MSTWILILTLTTSGHATAIAPVPGFLSVAECQRAGQSWLSSVANSAGGWVRPAVACVEQKKA